MRYDIKKPAIELLLKGGFVSYAKALSECSVFGDPDVRSAYVNQVSLDIVIGNLFLNRGDKFMSLAIRHELSHLILNHYNRMLNHGVDNYEIWNCAADAELSNYYTDEDRQEVLSKPFMSGSVDVVLNQYFVGYKGWRAEDIYDDMIKNFPSAKKDEKFFIISPGNGQQKLSVTPDGLGGDVCEINTQRTKTEADKVGVTHKDRLVFSRDRSIFYDIESDFMDVIKPKKTRTFNRENCVYADGNIIVACKSKQKKKTATIHCFRDVSGSMTKERTDSAVEVVKLLSGNKNISVVEHTFSNDIDNIIGGGTNYDAIVQYCKHRNITDIAIVTDDDTNNVVTNYLFNRAFIIGVGGCVPNIKIFSKTIKMY